MILYRFGNNYDCGAGQLSPDDRVALKTIPSNKMSHEWRWVKCKKSVPCSTTPFTLRSLALEWEGVRVSNRDGASEPEREGGGRYVMHWITTSVCLGDGHFCYTCRAPGFNSTSKRQIKVSA